MGHTYQFDLEEAKQAIISLNGDLAFSAAEHLVHQHFNLGGADFVSDQATNARRVVLLDALWATQLFWDPGAHERILTRLHQNAEHLNAVLGALGEHALRDEPDAVWEAAREIFPIVMGRHQMQEKQKLSFASKFMHWSTRWHFPIVDKNARKAINRFQRDHGIRRGQVLSDTAAVPPSEILPEYKRWVFFYSDLIRSLEGAGAVPALLEADSASQIEGLTVDNTLLRILDKVFYWKGSRL